MRIYFLAQRVPFPPDRGDKITTYNELRYLAADHEVEVFCLADGEDDLQNTAALRALSDQIHAVPLSRARGRLRALLAMATREPLTVAFFREEALQDKIIERFAKSPPDLILVYSSSMAQYVEEFANTPRLMQFAELDSLKWADHARLAPLPKRWLYRSESERLLSYERKIAESFSHSLVCTQEELREFERLVPGAPVTCIPNGVDSEYFAPSEGLKKGNHLIFTGVMDYFPNVDGISWFCQEILPLIRRQVPELQLTICGSRPVGQITRLQRIPGVTVTERVPDVRPYLDRADVAVVPLRIGRGIQNKVLEAMSMALPCVTTRTACMGIEAKDGRDLLVANDPSEFARHVVRLLSDDAARKRLGTNARATIKKHYSWAAPLAKLSRVIELEAGGGRERPVPIDKGDRVSVV